MKRLCSAALTISVCLALGCATMARVEAKFDSDTDAKVQKCDALKKYDVQLDEERAIGGALAVGMVAHNNGVLYASVHPAANDPLNTYVNQVGRTLAALSARPDLPWTFGVIDTPNVNAFSTPGGYVFVSRGLLAKIHTEAELAGVLGHEIGHVVLKHALEKYKQVKAETCAAAITKAQAKKGLNVVGNAANDVVNGIANSFTGALGRPDGYIDLNSHLNFNALFRLADAMQDAIDSGFDDAQETAADKMGLMLAIEAGYNPKPFIDFIRQLPDGGSGVFAHHPPSQERAEALAQWPEWLKEEGSLVSEEDVKAYPIVELDQRISAATAP